MSDTDITEISGGYIDVRRSLNLKQPIYGYQLMNALNRFIDNFQKPWYAVFEISDLLDGMQFKWKNSPFPNNIHVGLNAIKLEDHLILRVGDNLQHDFIMPNVLYNSAGIGTTSLWYNKKIEARELNFNRVCTAVNTAQNMLRKNFY